MKKKKTQRNTLGSVTFCLEKPLPSIHMPSTHLPSSHSPRIHIGLYNILPE